MFSFNSSSVKILMWIAIACLVVSSTSSFRLNANQTGKSVTIKDVSPTTINDQQNDGIDDFLNFTRQKMKATSEFFEMLMRPFRPPPLFTVNIICAQNNTSQDKSSPTVNNTNVDDDSGSANSTTPDIIQTTTDKPTDKPSNQTNLSPKDKPKKIVKRTLATTTAIRAQTRLGNAPGRSPFIAPANPVRRPSSGR